MIVGVSGSYFFLSFNKKVELRRFTESLGDVPRVEDVEILNPIGSGNFGVVYLGQWNENQVALKQLKLSNAEGLYREMEIMSKCRHPNGSICLFFMS